MCIYKIELAAKIVMCFYLIRDEYFCHFGLENVPKQSCRVPVPGTSPSCVLHLVSIPVKHSLHILHMKLNIFY